MGRGGTRSVGTCWDALPHAGTPWDDTLINSSFGTRWDALGRGGTRWDAVGRGGTRWDALKLGRAGTPIVGTRWDAYSWDAYSGRVSWDAVRLGRAQLGRARHTP